MARILITAHHSHNYRILIRRWRALARTSGLILRNFAVAGDMPVFFLRSRAQPESGGIYISAGIHGDESAGTEALISWAEQNPKLLSRLPCIFFPCLNPWGLANNS